MRNGRVLPSLVALTSLAGLAAAACGGESGAPGQRKSEFRDSAGIRIVENPRPPSDSRLKWEVGEEPSVSIGSVEGEEAYQLYRADDATKLPDGRIVVANGGTLELLVFDEVGGYLTVWGSRGDGPGEFAGEGILKVEPWPGDSVMACHGFDDRISLFDSEGDFGRDYRLGAEVASRTRMRDVLPDGSILASEYIAPEGFSGRASSLVRAGERHRILAADGSARADLGRYPGAEAYRYVGDFDFEWRAAFHRSDISAAWGQLAVVGANDRYEIRAYDADGALVRIVRRDHDPRRPAQAEVDRHFERILANMSEGSRGMLATVFESMPAVEALPAFAGIMADALGYLWVEEFRLDGEASGAPGLWTVFDPEGRVRGFVETPSGLDIHEIGADYILGDATGELGVQYVRLWSLSR